MHRSIRAAALAVAASAAVAGLGAAPAGAATKVTGETVVKLSDAATGALAAAGVTVSPIGAATASDGAITLPVARGRVNAKRSHGVVAHRGGIALASAERTVRLRRFVVVNTRGRHFVAVKVGRKACRGARKAFGRRVAARHSAGCAIRAFALTNRHRADADGKAVLTADLALTKASARLLNLAFGTSFEAGQPAGSGTMTLAKA